MDRIYQPIEAQLDYWIDYAIHDKHNDAYRKIHDLDCILTGGNLYADTIFSLWMPLKYVLKQFGFSYISNLQDKTYIRQHLEELLPADSIYTQKLSRLIELGRTKANVMILPDRKMQGRGAPPYWDYMPHFLAECFAPGAFSVYFENDAALREWIREQRLEVFFTDGIPEQNHIRDLAGTGNVRNSSFRDVNLEQMLDSYIDILQKRM